MRVLLYGINFPPELSGIGKYTGEMAYWLASRGHSIRVVTAPPYYPNWKIADGYSSRQYRFEILNRVEVWRCPLYVPVKASGFQRILHLASFSLSSLPVLLRQVFWRPDLVWVVEPALMCAPGAALVARLSGAKSWLHVQDFEVDAAFDLGLVKSGWLKQLVLRAETRLMRRFDRVSTISTGMLGKLIDKGVNKERTALFPNWVDVEAIFPDKAAGEKMRAELGLPDRAKVALYSGNMGEKQGLEYVIEAARALLHTELIIVLCGDGANRTRLQAAAQNLPNLRWLPLQPVEKLNALLNMPDVHLLPQKRNAGDLVMPSKLTGIFASGIPVIAMAEPGTTVYEAVSERGIVIQPEDATALAQAMTHILADEVEQKRLGAAGRQFAVETLKLETILSEMDCMLRASLMN